MYGIKVIIVGSSGDWFMLYACFVCPAHVFVLCNIPGLKISNKTSLYNRNNNIYPPALHQPLELIIRTPLDHTEDL